jgi:hypothetical protein
MKNLNLILGIVLVALCISCQDGLLPAFSSNLGDGEVNLDDLDQFSLTSVRNGWTGATYTSTIDFQGKLSIEDKCDQFKLFRTREYLIDEVDLVLLKKAIVKAFSVNIEDVYGFGDNPIYDAPCLSFTLTIGNDSKSTCILDPYNKTIPSELQDLSKTFFDIVAKYDSESIGK